MDDTQPDWSGDHKLYGLKLKRDTSPLGRARLDYFWLNKGRLVSKILTTLPGSTG